MPSKDSQVGNVNKMYIISDDQLGNRYESIITSQYIRVNPIITYAKLDQKNRSLVTGISTNTYYDTLLIKTISLNNAVSN